MTKQRETNSLRAALYWIGPYCGLCTVIRGNLGDESPVMLAVLAAFAVGILIYVKKNDLTEACGLVKWRGRAGEYLYFLPMLFLMTGNLWRGIEPAYSGMSQLFTVLSMLLIGFIEEMIFRGLLFRALLEQNSAPVAISISAVTFGIGHLVNLLAGQGGVETLIQVVFAILWGYLFTLVFYYSESLLVCIPVHGLINAFSKFAASSGERDLLYPLVTVAVSLIYCIYLYRRFSRKQ